MPKALSIQDIEISMIWLEQMERAQITQVRMASVVGLSESQFSRRMSLARRYRQEQERRESSEPDVDQPEIGDDDALYLELVDERLPESKRHDYYDLRTDATSHDGTGCFVHIGTGRGGPPRRNRLGSGKHVDGGQSYKARNDGLRGGKG